MDVKDKRRIEFAVRSARLHQFGYADYTEYIHSKHWRLTRAAYFAHPDAPKRCFCGESDERQLRLHHKTYTRLGAEDLRDLHPLCDTCHHDVHLIAKRGLAPFDLADYANDDRQAHYAEQWRKDNLRQGRTDFERPYTEEASRRASDDR